MLPCWIATFDKLNNFYSFLILVHFYRDFAQFGHVVSLGHYVMGSEEILKLEEYIKKGLEIHGHSATQALHIHSFSMSENL